METSSFRRICASCETCACTCHTTGSKAKWGGTKGARAAASVAALVLACGPLPQGESPIPGSRPGMGDDPEVIEPGSVQAEAGLDSGREAGSGFTTSELLLRFGVLPGAEARVAIGHYAGGPGPATGAVLEDLELSLKLQVAEGGTGVLQPAVALLPQVAVPTGAARVSAGSAEPGAILLAGWSWPELLEATVNLGGTVGREDDGRQVASFLSVAIGRELSERVQAELEVARIGGDEGLRHAAGGVAWLLGPDLQLDGWAGIRSGDGATTRFVGIGLSTRWPRTERP